MTGVIGEATEAAGFAVVLCVRDLELENGARRGPVGSTILMLEPLETKSKEVAKCRKIFEEFLLKVYFAD
jgi:hypothetical protein